MCMVWLWAVHCYVAWAHGRRKGGGCGHNINKAGCGIAPNDSEHGSLQPPQLLVQILHIDHFALESSFNGIFTLRRIS
jgi:hypothetical protein